jgi:hypothetical protein
MSGMKSKLHNEEPYNLSLLVKMIIPPLRSILTDWTMNIALGTNADGCTLKPNRTGLRCHFLRAHVKLDAVESVITTCGVAFPELSPFCTVVSSIHPHKHTHTHKVKNHKICGQEYSILRCKYSDLSGKKLYACISHSIKCYYFGRFLKHYIQRHSWEDVSCSARQGLRIGSSVLVVTTA